MLEIPNLAWGQFSTRKLGCYEYGSDTITISQIFRYADPILLDYVMYHEMLQKKYKFDSKNGRHNHHTKHFREMEAAFPNAQMLEKEINKLANKQYGDLMRLKKEQLGENKISGLRKIFSFFADK